MMDRQSNTLRQTEQHLRLWTYLLPVVGVIPAIWTLSRARNAAINSQADNSEVTTTLRQQQKVSRLAINLSSIWLCSYVLFSMGADNASQILSFRLLYANAIATTGYFVTCTFLMSRLSKKKRSLFEDLD